LILLAAGEDLNLRASAPVSETPLSFPKLLKVDVSALNIGSDQLHAEPVADVQTFKPFHQLTLNGQLEQTDPRTLLGCAGYDGIEPLSDSRFKQYCCGRFSDLTFDPPCRVFLFRTMLCERQ
jgi:hypothetical protein